MRIGLTLLLVGLACGALGGCGESSPEDPDPRATAVRQPAPPYDSDQVVCPVCGRGIDKEYHADVDTPKGRRRFYFDKQECAGKFNQAPRRYRENYDNRFLSPKEIGK